MASSEAISQKTFPFTGINQARVITVYPRSSISAVTHPTTMGTNRIVTGRPENAVCFSFFANARSQRSNLNGLLGLRNRKDWDGRFPEDTTTGFFPQKNASKRRFGGNRETSHGLLIAPGGPIGVSVFLSQRSTIHKGGGQAEFINRRNERRLREGKGT